MIYLSPATLPLFGLFPLSSLYPSFIFASTSLLPPFLLLFSPSPFSPPFQLFFSLFTWRFSPLLFIYFLKKIVSSSVFNSFFHLRPLLYASSFGSSFPLYLFPLWSFLLILHGSPFLYFLHFSSLLPPFNFLLSPVSPATAFSFPLFSFSSFHLIRFLFFLSHFFRLFLSLVSSETDFLFFFLYLSCRPVHFSLYFWLPPPLLLFCLLFFSPPFFLPSLLLNRAIFSLFLLFRLLPNHFSALPFFSFILLSI